MELKTKTIGKQHIACLEHYIITTPKHDEQFYTNIYLFITLCVIHLML